MDHQGGKTVREAASSASWARTFVMGKSPPPAELLAPNKFPGSVETKARKSVSPPNNNPRDSRRTGVFGLTSLETKFTRRGEKLVRFPGGRSGGQERRDNPDLKKKQGGGKRRSLGIFGGGRRTQS